GSGGRGGGGGGRGGGGGAPAGPALAITADAEASLPLILDEVKRQITADKRRALQDRIAKHTEANQKARIEALTQAVQARRAGWDASPISTARVYSELWPLIMNEDWCLSSPSGFSGGHNSALWDHNKPYSYLGGQSAGGIGYGAPASAGATPAAQSREAIVSHVPNE